MIVVIDTNILFSACISANEKLLEILFNPTLSIERVSCYYAFAELFKHQPRIVELSKQPADKVSRLLHVIMKQIEFFNDNVIDDHHLQEADRLTSGVDKDDVTFVALALQKDAWLWTGDKKLTSHLRAMGFQRVIATNDLFDLLKL